MNHSCLDNVIFSTIKIETCFSYNNYDKNRKFTFLKIESITISQGLITISLSFILYILPVWAKLFGPFFSVPTRKYRKQPLRKLSRILSQD